MKKLPLVILTFFFTYLSIAQVNRIENLDVFNLEYISDPQISPDGNKIIYVRNYMDVMTDKNLSNLWIINFDGTENRPLTTGNQNDITPQWSPDGSKVLYKSNKDGTMQLYLRWLDTGAETKLTNLPKSPVSFEWSPDGKFIAFNMFVSGKPQNFTSMPSKPEGARWNDPPKFIDKLNYRADGRGYLKEGYMQLFTLSKEGGTPRQITFEDNDHWDFDWSKDGEKIFFTANSHEIR